jgi:hypothetical protein
VPQSRTTTGRAGRREFLIHLVSLHLSSRQHTPPAVVPARDKLPKVCIAQCCRRRQGILQRTVALWADADCPGVIVRRRQTSPHDPNGNLRRHAQPVLRFSERARPARKVGRAWLRQRTALALSASLDCQGEQAASTIWQLILVRHLGTPAHVWKRNAGSHEKIAFFPAERAPLQERHRVWRRRRKPAGANVGFCNRYRV